MKLPQAFEMTISRADFVRLLPAAVGHQPFQEAGSVFSGRSAEADRGCRWTIALTPLPALRIGAICLERHHVQIDFEGYADAGIAAFLTRFEFYFRRGGG